MEDFRTVDTKDIAILRLVDGLRSSFQWVPFKILESKLPWNYKKLKRSIKDMAAMDLLTLNTRNEELFIKLKLRGSDTLSLWELKNHNAIETIGDVVGTGKEAVIINAQTAEGEWVILKIHRYFKKEFDKIKRSLSYSSVLIRNKQLNISESEVDVPRAKAQTEAWALELAKKSGIYVPELRGINRHILVMDMISADEGVLATPMYRMRLENPQDCFDILAEDLYNIVTKAQLVHGDLSEFNILLDEEQKLCYIDWPQAVPTNYKYSNLLLERDITNIKRYFENQYKIDTSQNSDLNELMPKSH